MAIKKAAAPRVITPPVKATPNPAASSGKKAPAKPHPAFGFATEADAIAGGVNVARPMPGLPDAWGLGGSKPTLKPTPGPNANAVQHANPNARFKRGPGKPKPASRRRPTRPTTRTRA